MRTLHAVLGQFVLVPRRIGSQPDFLHPVGKRIAGAVEKALARACTNSTRRSGEFYRPAEMSEMPVRNRAEAQSRTLKKPEMIDAEEFGEAMARICETHPGVNLEELQSETSRALGFKSTSAKLRQLLERSLQDLLRSDRLVDRGGQYYVD